MWCYETRLTLFMDVFVWSFQIESAMNISPKLAHYTVMDNLIWSVYTHLAEKNASPKVYLNTFLERDFKAVVSNISSPLTLGILPHFVPLKLLVHNISYK